MEFESNKLWEKFPGWWVLSKGHTVPFSPKCGHLTREIPTEIQTKRNSRRNPARVSRHHGGHPQPGNCWHISIPNPHHCESLPVHIVCVFCFIIFINYVLRLRLNLLPWWLKPKPWILYMCLHWYGYCIWLLTCKKHVGTYLVFCNLLWHCVDTIWGISKDTKSSGKNDFVVKSPKFNLFFF